MLVRDNKNIPIEDKDFFILLRIGLWQKTCPEPVEGVEEPLSDNPDWEYIYNLSIEQTVQGLIADGIGIYRKEYPELNIPQSWNDKFLSASAQIVRRNFAINQMQAKICKLLNEQNIAYAVMKGQTVGQYYPKPNLRCSGDIDFFFDDQNYESAKSLLEPLADGREDEDPERKHCGFFFGGSSADQKEAIEVELHADEGKGIARQGLFKKILETEMKSVGESFYYCGDVKVYTAPATFEVTHSFLHIMEHLVATGIGIRQYCDLAMILTKRKEFINKKMLTDYLRQLHLTSEWNVQIRFITETIGLPKEFLQDFIFKESWTSRLSRIARNQFGVSQIWIECKKTGNFGHKERAENEELREHYSHSFIGRRMLDVKSANSRFKKQRQVSLRYALLNYKLFLQSQLTLGCRKIFRIK